MPAVGEKSLARMETGASSIDVCRLCAQSNDSRPFIPLYTNDKRERVVAKQINQLVANLVSPDDGLPQTICTKCSKNVETCYSFVCNVIETQHKLKRMKRVTDRKRKHATFDDESGENCRSRDQVDDICHNESESDSNVAAIDDFIELLVVHPEEMVQVDVNGMLDDSQRLNDEIISSCSPLPLPLPLSSPDLLSRFKQEHDIDYDHVDDDDDQDQDQNEQEAVAVAMATQQTLLVIENNGYEEEVDDDDDEFDNATTLTVAVKEEPKEICFANDQDDDDVDYDVRDDILHLQEEQHVTWIYQDSAAQHRDESAPSTIHECDVVYKCELCANTYENEILFQAHNCEAVAAAAERQRYNDGGEIVIVGDADADASVAKTRNVFQCNVCDRVFKSKFVFKLHYAQHKKSNVCQLCNACFLDSRDLQTHFNQAHSAAQVNMDVDVDVDDNAAAAAIYEEVTTYSAADSEKQCDVCGKITDNLKQHKMYHTIKELEYCKAENKKFLKKWFYCQKCNKKIFSEANYLFHVAKHNGQDTVSCRQCDFVAVNIQDYNMHITSHTGGKYFICNDCEKCFFTRSAISDHVLIHMDGTRYMCEICGKRFKTSRSNAQHKLLQHKKYFRCNRCNRGFTHEAKLNTHYNICRVINQDQKESKVFEPVEKFFCNICNSNIKSSSEISILFHKAKHEGKDGVQCKFCALLCKNACMYKNHLLIHTNQRPYSCTQCPKSFRTKGCLVQHMLVHGDEYKYTCEYCGKKSKKLTTHVNHVNIHTDTKPYKCPDCDRPFRQLSDMKKHRRTHLKYKNDSTATATATATAAATAVPVSVANTATATATALVTTQLPNYLAIKTEVEDMIAADNIQQLQLT